MLDLFKELSSIVSLLDENEIEYALCGGLALAVHSIPRATIDMDIMIPAESLDKALKSMKILGYTIPAKMMNLSDGNIKIQRISKADPESEDVLSLDFLLVTPILNEIWNTREHLKWEAGKIYVASREGLIKMKLLRNSNRDKDDIQELMEEK